MMENNGYSLSDIAAASGNRNNNGFGGEGGWLIWIVLIFAIFGGWGNGFGGFGGGNGAGQGYATRADINEGFALNGIERGISSIQQGLCDSTYALNNAINGGFNSMGRLCATVSTAYSRALRRHRHRWLPVAVRHREQSTA